MNWFFQIAHSDGSVTNHEMHGTPERVIEWARNFKSGFKGNPTPVQVKLNDINGNHRQTVKF